MKTLLKLVMLKSKGGKLTLKKGGVVNNKTLKNLK